MQDSNPKDALIHEIHLEKSIGISFESVKSEYVMKLPEHINQQRKHSSYQRVKLELMSENQPPVKIGLPFAPVGIKYFVQGATFYGYNSEGVRDLGWGCAWRTIQTILSAKNINISFENLFHLFGRSDVLKLLYGDKYSHTFSPLTKFAP